MEFHSHNSMAVISFPPDGGYPRLTRASLDEIQELLDEVVHSGLFQGVVIAANSKSFPTGAAVEEVAGVEGIAAREFAARGQWLCNNIAIFPLPVVAAIRGYCLGGGLDLALACHGRVATYDASFGHTGASLGLMTGWGGTQRLPRILGKAVALQLFLTAERVPATQALTLGLVNELVPSKDLVDAACRRASTLGHKHEVHI
jgi:enoyl-CoA hydratase